MPHFKKKAVPALVRRQLAVRHGCFFGQRKKVKCHYCDKHGEIVWFEQTRGHGWVSFVDLEMDHVEPELRGGKTVLENLVLACLPCNRSKHFKTIAEWKGEEWRASAQ